LTLIAAADQFRTCSVESEVDDDLVKGDRVQFQQRESERRPGKPEAFNVELLI
jgi:hypothetical protein